MNQEEIDCLITKVLEGSASEEEKLRLDAWYRKVNQSRIEIPFASRGEAEKIQRRILKAVQQNVISKPKVVRMSRAKTVSAIAAALVAGVIGVSIYVTFSKKQDSDLASVQVKKTASDAAPGTNKATLILSTGKIIELNSHAEGVIGEDGNASVVKPVDGKVRYRPLSIQASDEVYNTMRTPRGGQYQLELPDGTQVWLNAASSITFPTVFAGVERNVDINGEAYFEVAHDSKRPFHVRVNGVTIEVLGTSFNINSYNNQAGVKTTLIEGKVNMLSGESMVTLRPGQEAIAIKDKIAVKDNSNVEDVLAWKNGLFSFDNAGIDEVLAEVSRWYDVEVSFEGEKPDQHYGGRIPRNLYASQMLSILEKSGVHYRIEEKKLIIMK